MSNAIIDDYQLQYYTYRPREASVKAPGQRRRITEPAPVNHASLVFPPGQNGQREVTYETACCNGPSTFVMTGKKMVDDTTVLSPGLLFTTARMPKRVTTRIEFNQTEN